MARSFVVLGQDRDRSRLAEFSRCAQRAVDFVSRDLDVTIALLLFSAKILEVLKRCRQQLESPDHIRLNELART